MSNNADNVCVVCFKDVHILSVGCCDHIVCYECSTRMRVLCRQNECPICRQDMELVVFTNEVKPFSELKNKTSLLDKKYNIAFTTKKVQDTFYRLLEHNCSMCRNRNFKTFQLLHQHMKREHERFYCDLCVDNLKILTSERRHYNRSELAQHRKKGDSDDKSHRGHPLCEFCDTRYMDNDDLYRHLRRDHLFCHFCDADGLHLYYSSYDYLRDHFRQEHFLCEEGACYEEKFTPVFRTEIDLRAHRAAEHGRSIGKAAVKQARTLEVEFMLKPRARPQDSKGRRGRPADPSFSLDEIDQQAAAPAPANLDLNHFPSLGNSSGGSSVPLTNLAPPQMKGSKIRNVERQGPQYDQHFPGLPGGSAAPSSVPAVSSNSVQERKPQPKSSNASAKPISKPIRSSRLGQDDFPALASNAPTPSTSTNWTSASKAPSNPSNWTAVASKRTANSQAKKQPESKPKQPPKPRDEDFPSLATKFTANLNFISNDHIESNFVNIKNKLSKDAKAVVSEKIKSEELKKIAEVEVESNKKPKKKKKKKPGADDTAKKKEDQKAVSPKKEKKNPVVISEKKSDAETTESKDNVNKPLPTAAEWFSLSNPETSNNILGEINNDSDVKSSQELLASLLSKSASKQTSGAQLRFHPEETTSAFLKVCKPPPGFTPTNGVKAPPGFTSPFMDLLQTYVMQYKPPVDFDKRNGLLSMKINEVLLNKETLDEFRQKSGQFRSGEITAEQYYQYCLKALGESGSTVILPELLVLLPDILKQQELYNTLLKHGADQKWKQKLENCPTCYQVVTSLEVKNHLASHVSFNEPWGFT